MHNKHTQLVLMTLTVAALLLPLAVLASGGDKEIASVEPAASTSEFSRGFANKYAQVGSRVPVVTGNKRQDSVTSKSAGSVMFIENEGQWAADARFQVWGETGSTVWLAEDAIWMTVLDPVEGMDMSTTPDQNTDTLLDRISDHTPHSGVNIRISFPGANPHPTIETIRRLDTKVSYFIGNDSDLWRPEVSVWGGVRYVDLWPGVDLEMEHENGRLTQRYVAKEGADLSAVQMLVEGAEGISLERNMLRLTAGAHDFTVSMPQADFNYQVTLFNDRENAVEVDTLVVRAVDSTTQAQSHDTAQTADNSADLIYSTFLGGSSGSGDYGYAVAVDEAGSAYVTGETNASDFPTTPGAFDTTYDGTGYNDTFVVKLSPYGSTILYATFLGGDGPDNGRGIAVDGTGSAYVVGYTWSDDFPTGTDSSFDRIHSGLYDAYVVKLSEEGDGLLYSTYLGGDNNEYGLDIAIDGDSHVYVTGYTFSSEFPTTPGAHDRSFDGSNDAFVVEIDTDTNELAYATFLGGGGSEDGNGIVVDSAGHAYVTGGTTSNDFPTTEGAFDTSFSDNNAYVVKLNSDGSGLSYATFLDVSNCYDIALDSDGNTYVTGTSGSSDSIITPGAFDTSTNGGGDSFVVKLNPQGNALVYGTFLGGSGSDYGYGIAVDGRGRAYVAGKTKSSDFPITPNAFDAEHNASNDNDAFVAKLNPAGSELVYATFLGGNDYDYGNDIAVKDSGVAYVIGSTGSSDFPTKPGSHDTSYSGNSDAFVNKLAMGEATPQKQVVVLVHGIKFLSDTQINCSAEPTRYPDNQNFRINDEYDPKDMPDWLYEDGFDVWSAYITTGPDSTVRLEENAECLRKQIGYASDHSPDGKVILIAHSMGGLVSRAYIEGDHYQHDVKTLITLGTPHLGAPRKWFAWLNDYLHIKNLDCENQPGMCQFTTGIGEFNREYASRNPSIDYYLISGDVPFYDLSLMGAGSRALLFGSLICVPVHFPLPTCIVTAPGGNDAVVSTASGLGLNDVRQKIQTEEAHSKDWADFSYFTPHHGPYSSAYVDCIRPVLSGNPDGCHSSLSTSTVDIEAPSFTAVSPIVQGAIASDQGIMHVVGVDGGGTALFAASWVTDTVAFTLTSPSGLIIDPAYASAHPEQVSYSHAQPEETPLGANYVITAAEAGEWTINLQAGTIPSGSTDYSTFVAMESPITLVAQTDSSWYGIDQSATISATLEGGFTAATVEAEIQRPDEVTDTILLVAQGGGLYQGEYDIPDISGYVGLTIVAEGTDSAGYSFSREAIEGFQIASEAATLEGTYADRAEDNDGDGRFEALEVDVGVTTHVSGTFSVAADLVTLTGGEEVAHAATSAQLDTGTHTVTLLFDGNAIRSKGLDGPYRVSSILLLDKSEATLPVEEATDVWTTAAYTASDFGTCYTPVITADPIDGGQVAIEPTPDCGGGTKISFGTPVTLTAEAEPDYYFDYWLGEVFSRTNPLTFNLYDDRELTAMFEPVSNLPTDIANNVDSIELTWTHLDPNVSHQVWRDIDPNFDPDNPGPNTTQLPDAAPPVSGDTVVYTDDTIDPSTNFYYIIRGVNSLDDITSVSNPVGVFYFNMEPGS